MEHSIEKEVAGNEFGKTEETQTYSESEIRISRHALLKDETPIIRTVRENWVITPFVFHLCFMNLIQLLEEWAACTLTRGNQASLSMLMSVLFL